jgi:hypothetical protein
MAAALAAVFSAASLPAEVLFDPVHSTGLPAEAWTGYLGPSDNWDRFVIQTDEPDVILLFIFDQTDLRPVLRVEQGGVEMAEADLAKGNEVRLTGGGEFVCTITARAGAGHWICIALSARQWEKNPREYRGATNPREYRGAMNPREYRGATNPREYRGAR